MKIFQQTLDVPQKRRGFHIITYDVVEALPQLHEIKTGICQVFIQHTSASLSINENADPTVRQDFEMYFNKAVPENDPDYRHDDEGPDDMPAHLKAAMLGCSVPGRAFIYANTATTAVQGDWLLPPGASKVILSPRRRSR
jgi:secondary thiamine-phosphate synthase enzyme